MDEKRQTFTVAEKESHGPYTEVFTPADPSSEPKSSLKARDMETPPQNEDEAQDSDPEQSSPDAGSVSPNTAHITDVEIHQPAHRIWRRTQADLPPADWLHPMTPGPLVPLDPEDFDRKPTSHEAIEKRIDIKNGPPAFLPALTHYSTNAVHPRDVDVKEYPLQAEPAETRTVDVRAVGPLPKGQNTQKPGHTVPPTSATLHGSANSVYDGGVVEDGA